MYQKMKDELYQFFKMDRFVFYYRDDNLIEQIDYSYRDYVDYLITLIADKIIK